MSFLSKKVSQIPPSGIRKFFDLVLSAGPDVISLGVGEPDFPTPWHIRESAIFALEKGFTSYTENAGLFELREAISQTVQKETQQFYDPRDQIIITNGVSEGMDLAFRAIIDEGDEVLVPDPGYVMYAPLIQMAGGTVRFYDPLDLSTIQANISNKTKALLLNFPGNPIGNTFSKTDLEKIVDITADKNILLLSDEIYAGLSFEQTHTSLLQIPNATERTIYFNGLSKTHAMTGIRVGWATGPTEIIQAMNKIHQYSALCTSSISQIAAIEALKRGKTEAEKMKQIFNKRRKKCIEILNNMNFKFHKPQGAFYIFIDISSSGLDAITFCEQLLQKQKLATVPGSAFGEKGKGYIRITYASSMEELIEAFKRLERFMKSL